MCHSGANHCQSDVVITLYLQQTVPWRFGRQVVLETGRHAAWEKMLESVYAFMWRSERILVLIKLSWTFHFIFKENYKTEVGHQWHLSEERLEHGRLQS